MIDNLNIIIKDLLIIKNDNNYSIEKKEEKILNLLSKLENIEGYFQSEYLLKVRQNELKNVDQNINLKLIKENKIKLFKTDIYSSINLIDKNSLKPKLIVSIIAFSIYGFFASILVMAIYQFNRK